MKKKRVNSCHKGKAGERALVLLLKSMGFNAERLARNGVKGCHDVVCHDLPNIMLECKYGVKALGLGTKVMDEVINQAKEDAARYRVRFGAESRSWAILWFEPHKSWRITWLHHGVICTACGEATIAGILRELNGEKKGE